MTPTAGAGMCSRCVERLALVTLSVGGGPPEALCGRCVERLAGREPDLLPPYLLRFYRRLARPTEVGARDGAAPGAPACSALCPACGLAVADLMAAGLAGCPRCYTAHGNVLADALQRMLDAGDEDLR
ncbi:MAG TPA: hypothetical protein VLH79_00715 [Chthonomonadales bacterium]|nr:hypothetical protein [Chthonomonadales bacterium]